MDGLKQRFLKYGSVRPSRIAPIDNLGKLDDRLFYEFQTRHNNS